MPHPLLKSQFGRAGGFTLLEVTTILSVLVILSAIMLPQIRGYIQSAQRVRAKNDLQSISNSMSLYLRDMGSQSLYIKDCKQSSSGKQAVKLLVSSGDIPELGEPGDAQWLEPVNNTTIDFLDNYLITNTPGSAGARRFQTPQDENVGRFAWRGSYAAGPLTSDPWGNRYMINVLFLHPGFYEDVVVFSAGPNEKVETEFACDGLIPDGDDLVFLLARDGGGKYRR